MSNGSRGAITQLIVHRVECILYLFISAFTFYYIIQNVMQTFVGGGGGGIWRRGKTSLRSESGKLSGNCE